MVDKELLIDSWREGIFSAIKQILMSTVRTKFVSGDASWLRWVSWLHWAQNSVDGDMVIIPLPLNLPIVGAVEPRGEAFYPDRVWEEFKRTKYTDLGANHRLCSGVPWLPIIEIWSTNLEPQPSKSDSETAPGAQTAAWIGRLFPQGWLLVWPYLSLSFIT